MENFSEEELLKILKDDDKLEEFLNTLNGEDIKRYLIYINSRVRNISIDEGCLYEGDRMLAGELISPKGQIQEKYFDKMAELLKNVKGRKNKATIMYYLINDLHLFQDGNGRTSRCIYELLANQEFDINANDYFSHNGDDLAKISGWKFEEDKNILRTKYAGNYSSYFLLRYLMDSKLINSNEELARTLSIETFNDSDLQSYSGVYISQQAQQNLSARDVALVNRALLDNNENYSVGGLTMLIMLARKENTEKLENFSYSSKKPPEIEGYISRADIWIDNEEEKNISVKSMGDWTSEDYLVAIEIADKIKESMMDTLIDIFEQPESFRINKGITVAQKITHYKEIPFEGDSSIRDAIELHKAQFKINKNTRTYAHMHEIRKILECTKSISKVQSIQELGKQTLKQQEDTKSKDAVETFLANQEKDLNTNIQKGD